MRIRHSVQAVLLVAGLGSAATAGPASVCTIFDPNCLDVLDWYVSPSGSSKNAGTLASPWSLEHALSCAGGRILPGHRVNLRGGTYQRLPTSPGFTITCSGTPARPIVYRAYAGEQPVIEGALPEFAQAGNDAWEPVPGGGPGHNVYRSKATFTGVSHFTGFVSIGREWMTLIVHGHPGQAVAFLSSDIHTQRQKDVTGIAQSQSVLAGASVTIDGTYASGGVATLPDPSFVGGTWTNPAVVTITGTDPDGAPISEVSPTAVASYNGKKLFKTVTQVSFSADVEDMAFGTTAVPRFLGPGLAYDTTDKHIYIRLDNSTAEAQYNRPGVLQIVDPDPRNHDLRIAKLNSIGLDVQASNLVIQDLDIDDFGQGLQTAGAANVTFVNLDVRPGYFGARLGNASNVSFKSCRFHARMPSPRFWMAYSDVKGSDLPADNTRKLAIDLGTATNVSIVNSEINEFFDGILSQTTSHHITLRGNVFRQVWDDAWQMSYGIHDVDIGYNKFFGAGLSRDGTGTGASNPASGTVWIHHNVFAPNEQQIFLVRFGAALTPGTPPDFDSVVDAIPLSAHGLPQTGENRFSWPWKLYYNTVVVKDPQPGSGIGVLALGGNLALLYDGSPHEVYNNIFVDPSGQPLARDFVADNGHEMYDGNVFAGAWRATPLPVRPAYRFVHTSNGIVNGANASTPLWGPQSLRANPTILADTQAYPIPSFQTQSMEGWEKSGLSMKGLEFDASYRPLGCPECSTGAVSLTASRWPGTSTYEPWRGAIQP